MAALDIARHDNFGTCESQLQEVLHQAQNPNPFLTVAWLKLWWEYFGAAKQLCILVFWHDQTLVGFAPFYRVDKPFSGLAAFQLLGSGFSSYLDLVCAPGYEESVCDALFSYFQNLREPVIVDFGDFNNRFSQFYKTICRRAKQGKQRASIRRLDICPLAVLANNWDDFFNNQRERKSRYNLKRSARQLANLGELRLRDVTDAAELATLWPYLERLHEERFRGRRLHTLFQEQRRRFWAAALAAGLGRQATLSILELDGALISFVMGFRMGDVFIDFAPAFDPAFSSLSLGHIHLMQLIQQKIEEKFHYFDFSKGDSAYKSWWSNDETISYLFRFGFNVSNFSYWHYDFLDSCKNHFSILKRLGYRKGKKTLQRLRDYLERRLLKKDMTRVKVEKLSEKDIKPYAENLRLWSYNKIRDFPLVLREAVIDVILISEQDISWLTVPVSEKSVILLSEDRLSGYRLSL